MVIGIDELDKINDPEAVRALLRDIKGILEVTGVHFLVSVSEEAAAALQLGTLQAGVGLEYTIGVVTCVFSQLHEGPSGDKLVFVREPAEDLFSADPVLGEVDLRWPRARLGRCELAEGAVWPGGVVVLQVFGQYLAQMVLIDDQQLVEELAAQGNR